MAAGSDVPFMHMIAPDLASFPSKHAKKWPLPKKDSYVKTDVLCKSEVSFIGSTILLIAARRES